MKTSSTTRFFVLLAGTVMFAVGSIRAQSSFAERMRAGGGCPFCNPGGQRNYGDMPYDSLKPDFTKTEPALVNPPPPTVPAVQAPTAPPAVVAVTTARAKPGLTQEQATTLAAQLAAATPDQPLKREPDGSWNVSFGQLASYRLDAPAPGAVAKPGSVERIPEPLRKLDGEKVRVSGFMLPVKVEGGLATEFLIVRNPLVCCYGMMPAPNEWVCVKVAGKGVPMQMDTPLQFSGTLHVGEIYENDFFVGVYRLDADKVSVN
jgi:hypothetical protein